MMQLQQKAKDIAIRTAEAYDICGLLAVELFVTADGEILVNEVAPRPHNSGHHTIEACYTSQFEQHVRAVLNLTSRFNRAQSRRSHGKPSRCRRLQR